MRPLLTSTSAFSCWVLRLVFQPQFHLHLRPMSLSHYLWYINTGAVGRLQFGRPSPGCYRNVSVPTIDRDNKRRLPRSKTQDAGTPWLPSIRTKQVEANLWRIDPIDRNMHMGGALTSLRPRQIRISSHIVPISKRCLCSSLGQIGHTAVGRTLDYIFPQ